MDEGSFVFRVYRCLCSQALREQGRSDIDITTANGGRVPTAHFRNHGQCLALEAHEGCAPGAQAVRREVEKAPKVQTEAYKNAMKVGVSAKTEQLTVNAMRIVTKKKRQRSFGNAIRSKLNDLFTTRLGDEKPDGGQLNVPTTQHHINGPDPNNFLCSKHAEKPHEQTDGLGEAEYRPSVDDESDEQRIRKRSGGRRREFLLEALQLRSNAFKTQVREKMLESRMEHPQLRIGTLDCVFHSTFFNICVRQTIKVIYRTVNELQKGQQSFRILDESTRFHLVLRTLCDVRPSRQALRPEPYGYRDL